MMSAPIDAAALIFTGDHESLNKTETQRTNEILMMMLLAGDGSDCFSLAVSQELSINLVAGCDHYGSEVCGGHA